MDRKEAKAKEMLEKIRYPQRDLPETFAREFHQKLKKAQTEKAGSFSNVLQYIFMLALAVMIFSAGIFFGRNYHEKTIVEKQNEFHTLVKTETDVSVGEAVTIRLVYNAKKDIDNVKFAIKLSQGVSFASNDNDIREAGEIEWGGSLKKGRNEIPFVVEARSMGEFLVKAHAEYEGAVHSHNITLKASPVEKGRVI